MPLTKVKSKKPRKNAQKALAFFRGICSSQHKILRVCDTHIDIFQEKKLLGHNSTVRNLKMEMRKTVHFQTFCKK